MARKRMIDPDLWTDDRVQALPSPTAILFYIGTISHADDEGRIEWSPRQLAARIFALREDVRPRDVEAAMAACESSGLIRVYEVQGRRYGYHPTWRKHQYVNRPHASKLPEPPEQTSLLESRIVSRNGSRSEAGIKTRTEAVNEDVRPHVPLESESVMESESVRSAPNGSDRPEWLTPIAEAVNAVRERDLSALTPDEAFAVAQWHAYRFANCTRSAAKNKTTAVKVRSGLTALADRTRRDGTPVTVATYLKAAKRVWKRGGEKPWFRPFDVLAEFVEAAQ